MNARIGRGYVREGTYADAIAKQAHDADPKTDRPIDIRRHEPSQRDRDGYEDKSPEPRRTEAVFWDPYSLALFPCLSYNPIGDIPRNRGPNCECKQINTQSDRQDALKLPRPFGRIRIPRRASLVIPYLAPYQPFSAKVL